MEKADTPPTVDDLGRRQVEDRQLIARLQQRLESQAFELQEQARQIQKLEEKLARLPAKPAAAPLDEQILTLKSEILQIIEAQYTRRQQNFKDVNNAMLAQLEGFARTLHELRREIDKTQRYDEQILLARTEVERVNRGVSEFEVRLNQLGKQFEERIRGIAYLEEQRRVDSNRLAELSGELPGLHKKIEASMAKAQLIEQQIPQFGQYQAALDQIREDIRRHREHMDFQMAQRERLMKNWNESADALQRRADDYKGLMDKYAEHYQLNKRALESLQELQERLQRDQHRASELQRLTEDRLQTEIQKWQADYEQRWKKQSLEWKPTFTDLQKNMESLQKQVEEMVKLSQSVNKQLDLLLQIIEEDVHARTAAAQDWQRRFEVLADQQG
jgi:chromosome segregation ATPase